MRTNLFSFLILFITLAFYIFFACYDGAVICVDSPTYINMDYSREPFYPLFLAFFRMFNSQNYLFYAVMVQSIFMAFFSWLLADYLKRHLKIHNLYSMLLYIFPIATSLLCRFAAKRGSMYTNSILTEGICTSFYLFFIYCVLKYLWDKSKKHLFFAWLTAFLLISTRKQMLMVLPILFFVVFIANYRRYGLWKVTILAGVICCLTLPAFKLFDHSYNYFLRGSFQGHTSSNRFISTMVFYNSTDTDASYINDTDIKNLFLEIYNTCYKKGILSINAEDGWFEEVNHFGDHYDHIQIDTMYPMIYQRAQMNIDEKYLEQNLTDDDIRGLYNYETDRITSVIISSVLPHQIPQLLKTLFYNFLSGIVLTVAQLKPIFIPYTIIMFFAYLILLGNLVYHCYKERTSPIGTLYAKNIVFSIITLLGILSNVLLVSSVIFCQTRYTIYNMPLFYMAGALLLYENGKMIFSKRLRQNIPST